MRRGLDIAVRPEAPPHATAATLVAVATLVALVAVAGASFAAPNLASAQARRPPVAISAHALFGDEMLLANAEIPVLCTLENRTDRALRGKLTLDVGDYRSARQRHEVRVDLPPRERRRVMLTPYVGDSSTLTVRYEVDGRSIAQTSLSVAYAPAATGIVILSDPPRLRASLLDMEVEQPNVGAYGAPRLVRLPVGTVPFDASSGDPILPDSAVGWSAVDLLIAGASDLERVGEVERVALTDWLRGGGEVLVFLRSEADITGPIVSSLLGPGVERYADAGRPNHDALVPRGASEDCLRGADIRTEAFGGSRRIGFGRAYVATFDGTAPPFSEATETQELVRGILSRTRSPGVDDPVLPLGRFEDSLGEEMWMGQGGVATLRTALDPNEGYRPALGLVAIVLFLYVIVVGPVNFTFIGRRNRPTLALVTTPIAAFACLVLMLGVGYLGKGARMRYRSVEIVEMIEGDDGGIGRRYTGLFLTRPSRFDLEIPERGELRLIRGAGGDPPPYVHGTEGTTLSGVSGGLWETVFTREDRIAAVGGTIVFERMGRRLTQVENGTTNTLHGGVVLDGLGNVYRVGDLAPGAKAAIPASAAMTIASTGAAFWGEDDYNLQQFSDLIGYDTEQRNVVDGVAKLLGGTYALPSMPVFVAWTEVERSGGDLAGVFARESDVVFVRVVPDLRDAVVPSEVQHDRPIQQPLEDPTNPFDPPGTAP